MAGFAAIAATSSAILGLLSNAAAGHPDFATASFRLYTSTDLQAPIGDRLVASLYLYHAGVNPSRRSASGRIDHAGRQLGPPLPLDLHYLLTVWSKDPVMQQRFFGWCVRVLADTPTLPSGLLNAQSPQPVFRQDETVDVVWENLTQDDVFDIWEVARANQQPSAAYLVRIVELESDVYPETGPLVQTTDIRYGQVIRP